MKRFAKLMLAAVIAAGAVPAGAHTDPNDDGNRYSTKRCDTYYRDGHDSGGNKADRQSHEDTDPADPGDVTGTGAVYVHQSTGHYAVRGEGFYLEVVGGGGYNRDGNQGGWAQGEVDLVEGGPDADFHGGGYAGTSGSNHSENACLSAADNKVGESGVQPNGTYCVLDASTPSCQFTSVELGLRVYAEFATGMKILVRGKRNGVMKTIHDIDVSGPFVNESRRYLNLLAGDTVTCTLTAGSNPAPAGRMSCSA